MRSFDLYLNPPASVRRVFRITLGAERGSELYKLGWSQIFQLAKQVCSLYKKQGRDISPEMVVDSWAADCMWESTENNTITSDDRLCGLASTTRDLTQQWELDYARQQQVVSDMLVLDAELNIEPKAPLEVRKAQWSEVKHAQRMLTIIKRLRPSVTSLDALEAFGSSASFDYDSHEFAEEYANNIERRLEFKQEFELDPDDARYLGTLPRDSTFEAKMKSDFRDRGRGSAGVLGGVYENTLPEPAFSKNPYRKVKIGGRWKTLPPKGWKNAHGSWDSRLPN
jgi:hypothetical protein